METKYNPKMLMGRTALNIVEDGKDCANYQIEISLIGQNEKPLKIIKDPGKEDDSLLVLQGSMVLFQDALEKAQDRLGEVTVYMGKPYKEFKSYKDFLEWLGVDD
ncbi:MAG: hypothetical protein MUP27_04210 [Desulfobacterales bacterium]|nr:hypothetical protein [Desulfobacterales bacterium]